MILPLHRYVRLTMAIGQIVTIIASRTRQAGKNRQVHGQPTACASAASTPYQMTSRSIMTLNGDRSCAYAIPAARTMAGAGVIRLSRT